MTINLTTAKTGLFARWGKIFGVWKRTEQFQSDIVDNATQSFQEAINEYVNTLGATANTDLKMATTLMSDPDGLRNSAGAAIWHRLLLAVQRTLIEMADADAKIPIRNVKEALIELRTQMDAAPATVDGTTISIGSATVAGTGNGTVILDVTPDKTFHSKIAQFPTARSETIVFRCMKDQSARGVVSGSEIFNLEGERAFPATDHRWPGGSGLRKGVPCTSDKLADGRVPCRNVLRNSNFDSWTSNTPNNWRIATGSAGSTVKDGGHPSVAIRGSSSLHMDNDGSTLIRVDQKLNSSSSTGTPVKVEADQLYAISLLVKKAGTVSGGSLRVGLAEEDGTIVSGSTFNTAHGSIGTSWTQLTHSFRAGSTTGTIPDPAYFMIQQSTAFTSGSDLYIGGVVLTKMYATAKGGVHCAIVPGTTDWVRGDTITIVVTNNGEGEFQKYLDRYFDLYNNGIFFPQDTGGSESVADSLIA